MGAVQMPIHGKNIFLILHSQLIPVLLVVFATPKPDSDLGHVETHYYIDMVLKFSRICNL